jgi:hypothetical protein
LVYLIKASNVIGKLATDPINEVAREVGVGTGTVQRIRDQQMINLFAAIDVASSG